MKSAKVKRVEALARQEERAKLSPQEQLQWLDNSGLAAVRERKRLLAQIEASKKPATIHPKHTRL